jgi:hypothetical protein
MSFQQVESESTGLRTTGDKELEERSEVGGQRTQNTIRFRAPALLKLQRVKKRPAFACERRDRECDALEHGDRSVRISADSDPAEGSADLTHRPEIKIGVEAIACGVERD